METKANYVMIGLFSLAFTVGMFCFVYWFQNIGGGGERAYYRIAFDGSVSGLRIGGTVLFNGIRVGEVTDLKLNPQKPEQVVATIAVDKNVAVRSDTQIGMEFQGLTGIASLSLRGGNPAMPPLDGTKDNPPLLLAPADATADATQTARDVLHKLDDFLTQNQQSLHGAIANIDKFTAVLSKNSERIDHIVSGLENLTGSGDGKGGEINEAVRSIRMLADHLDSRTAEITSSVNKLTASGGHEIQMLSVDARRTLSTIDRAVKNFDRNPSRLIWGGGESTLPEHKGR